MRVVVDFCIIPLGTGDDLSLSPYIAECQRILLEANLDHSLHAFGTNIEGEWDAVMAGSDACFAPVLTMVEAAHYDANTERSVYTDVEGLTHPAPAPRFSRTPSQIRRGTQALGADTVSVLEDSGMEASAIQALLDTGAAVGSE